MKANYKKYILDFKRPSGTSRGVLTQKETWFIGIQDGSRFGIGECGVLRSLSVDDRPDYEHKLQWVCDHIHWGMEKLWNALLEFPSIQFGLEQAFLSLASKDPFVLFPSSFTEKEAVIPINGLIWMGDENFMLEQIQQKLETGFDCIKMKIGALNFETELKVLAAIRKEYTAEQIELRVDANGAFAPENALEKLKVLADFDLHSIEQPIRQGNISAMAELCKKTPLPIALDEELIGVFSVTKKQELLQTIRPQYMILKPSLVGGIKGSMEWIKMAEEVQCKWWITSALESNIGLNAIAQWTYTLENPMPQGLGTGSLYTNNIESPLTVENGALYYDAKKNWNKNLSKELCT
ncbi:o-succinylbenzoate synthase [Spongiimicrobium salis]|uniref:o-succinylbenzoate synthase n=1 Tax=Spongiimicrobium salis TaxID=1667022 RepID=UPI00374DFB4D